MIKKVTLYLCLSFLFTFNNVKAYKLYDDLADINHKNKVVKEIQDELRQHISRVCTSDIYGGPPGFSELVQMHRREFVNRMGKAQFGEEYLIDCGTKSLVAPQIEKGIKLIAKVESNYLTEISIGFQNNCIIKYIYLRGENPSVQQIYVYSPTKDSYIAYAVFPDELRVFDIKLPYIESKLTFTLQKAKKGFSEEILHAQGSQNIVKNILVDILNEYIPMKYKKDIRAIIPYPPYQEVAFQILLGDYDDFVKYVERKLKDVSTTNVENEKPNNITRKQEDFTTAEKEKTESKPQKTRKK